MKKFFFLIFFISSFLPAEEETRIDRLIVQKKDSIGSIEICSEFMERNGVRLQLGQIWFQAGENPKDAKQLINYTVDYDDRPFAHIFSFNNLAQKKLWLNCVYFACGDNTCSPENASNDPVSVYHEIKNIPTRCKSKVKKENPTRIEYFTCKYK